MHHTFLDDTIDYHLSYKKKKTISVKINPYGQVTVEAPRDVDIKLIEHTLEQNWQWIKSKVSDRRERLSGAKERTYVDGEKFMYLGKTYPILVQEVSDIKKDEVDFLNNELIIKVKEVTNERVQKALRRFYYRKCKSYVESRMKQYQAEFREKPRGITINDDNAAWGTCNSRYEITFNWKLIMAPEEVVDYVIIHEMCHMVHLNHDRSFWRLVGKLCPQYQEKENWLALSSWKMNV